MIDQKKRNTLKVMVVSTGAIVVGSVAGSALSASGKTSPTAPLPNVENPVTGYELHPKFIASVHFTNRAHGIEVHILNASISTQTVKHISPYCTLIDSGEFRFADALELQGSSLRPGQSLVVPLNLNDKAQEHPLPTTLAERYELLNQLEAALRSSMFINTVDQDNLRIAIPRCTSKTVAA